MQAINMNVVKSFFKIIIGRLLAHRARSVLNKHPVKIIAVTGSVGKTSTKEAIYKILRSNFDVYSSKKSFNTEFGLSLAVLQEEESGFNSVLAWARILKNVYLKAKNPYSIIVLEMGADKPGDIKKLVKIASPQIGVVTAVKPVHLAEGQFKTLDEITKEKETLVRSLPKEGMAILNFDDERVRSMQTAAAKITYGMQEGAVLMAKDIRASSNDLRFEVTYQHESESFIVPVIGEFQIYVLLPAIAVGLLLGMKLSDCAKALTDFSLPPGRMNPIPGIHDSRILDSSYNASPATVTAALDLLSNLKADRKIAALGTMNELGEMSHEAHLDIGKKAAGIAELFIAVGPEAAIMKQGATDAGMIDSKIYTFFDSEDAGHFLKNELKSGDLVLVKGSQNRVRMEKLVKLVMKEPHKAKQLLCRQGEGWD